jgi:hypothetical protein
MIVGTGELISRVPITREKKILYSGKSTKKFKNKPLAEIEPATYTLSRNPEMTSEEKQLMMDALPTEIRENIPKL